MFNPYWLRMTPTLVSENFGLGIGFDPLKHQYYVQMTSTYFRISDTVPDYSLYETYYSERKLTEHLIGPTKVSLSREISTLVRG